MSDALTIARWCWPERRWKATREPEHVLGASDAALVQESMDVREWRDIHAAEQVMIERAGEDAYGAALYRELVVSMNGFHSYDENQRAFEQDLSVVATAPKDARVRALVRCIEEHGNA